MERKSETSGLDSPFWAGLIATSLEYPGENLALVICSILLHLNIVHIFLPALVCYLQTCRLSRIH